MTDYSLSAVNPRRSSETQDFLDRQKYLLRYNGLKTERQSWMGLWQALAKYLAPTRARFLVSDRNTGVSLNDAIINTAPIIAHRTLSSGMMAGITSPAREWFRLTTSDPYLAESPTVKSYLFQVENIVRQVYAKSNFYNGLSGGVYPDIGAYGTSCMFIEPDLQDVIRTTSLPIGSYCLGSDDSGRVNAIYREFSYTISQLVAKFGYDNCSQKVQELYDAHRYDYWIAVLHVVEPNENYNSDRMDSGSMKYISNWYELGPESGASNMTSAGLVGDPGTVGTLRKGGYAEFPAVCPRWSVTGEDIYGRSPGMDALGDCKALQLYERRMAQVLDKIVNPPMVGPTALRNQRASSLPGDVTYVDDIKGQYKPAFEPAPNAMQEAREAIGSCTGRINEVMFARLWMLITNDERTQPITAEEVRAKQEEKMLQLGPVLERLNDELLAPAIERTIAIMHRLGMLPPTPQELLGQDIKIEFISILAQAQKLVGTASVERLAGFAGTVSQVRPDVLDNLDVDEMLTKYADMLGTPPSVLRTPDEVAEVRAEKQRQQQAQEQGAAMAAGAKGVKDLSSANPDNLNQLLGQFAGAGQPSIPQVGGSPGGAP